MDLTRSFTITTVHSMASAARVDLTETQVFPEEEPFRTLAVRDALGTDAPLQLAHTCQIEGCPVGRTQVYTGGERLLLVRSAADGALWKVGHHACWARLLRRVDNDRLRRLDLSSHPQPMTATEQRVHDALPRNPLLNTLLAKLMRHPDDTVHVPACGWPLTDASSLAFRVWLHGVDDRRSLDCVLPIDGFVNVVVIGRCTSATEPEWRPVSECLREEPLPEFRRAPGSPWRIDTKVLVFHARDVERHVWYRVVMVGALTNDSIQTLQREADRVLDGATLHEYRVRDWNRWPGLGEWHRALITAARRFFANAQGHHVFETVTAPSEVELATGSSRVCISIRSAAPRENPRLVVVDKDLLFTVRFHGAVHLPLCVSGPQLDAAVRSGECDVVRELPRGVATLHR